VRIQMVSIQDAALQLGVSPDTVRRFVKKHQIPVLKLGRRCLLNQLTVEEISRQAAPPRAATDQRGTGG